MKKALNIVAPIVIAVIAPVLGQQVVATCQRCGHKWDAAVTCPQTTTGGVLIDAHRCPVCQAGYESMYVNWTAP